MSVAANRYSRALMDVLYPEQRRSRSASSCRVLLRFFKEQPDARRLLENPTMAGDAAPNFSRKFRSALGLDQRGRQFRRNPYRHSRTGTARTKSSTIPEGCWTIASALFARSSRCAAPRCHAAKRIGKRTQERTGKKIRMEIAGRSIVDRRRRRSGRQHDLRRLASFNNCKSFKSPALQERNRKRGHGD